MSFGSVYFSVILFSFQRQKKKLRKNGDLILISKSTNETGTNKAFVVSPVKNGRYNIYEGLDFPFLLCNTEK